MIDLFIIEIILVPIIFGWALWVSMMTLKNSRDIVKILNACEYRSQTSHAATMAIETLRADVALINRNLLRIGLKLGLSDESLEEPKAKVQILKNKGN